MIDSTHGMTHMNLQLGEGVLLRNIDLESVQNASKPSEKLAQAMRDSSCLIGATKEGATFRCVPQMIDITRGQRTPVLGETLVGRWEITLSGTMMEITQENVAMTLGMPMYAEVAESTELRAEPTAVPEYLDRVCWIGSVGNGLVAIELENPVSIGGLVFRASRNGLGGMAFTLMAHKLMAEDTTLPCRMLWMKEETA